MTLAERPLLILDIDETLIHALGRSLSHAPDFMLGPYHVYRRPYLAEFLASCSRHYVLAIWSSGGSEYVEGIVASIFQNHAPPAFVWSRNRCTTRIDAESRDEVYLKDLKKVKRLGFALSRTLIVEDEPKKVARHFGNAVYVQPFVGATDDCELQDLGRYLSAIHATADFRRLEKRGWRKSLV